MNESLNKILGQLEEDLRKLQSAKEQVESIIESNQGFTNATNDLVKSTESLVAKVETATEGVIGHFSNKLIESKIAVDKIVDDSIKRFDSNVAKIEVINHKLKEATETKVNEVSVIASNSIEKNTTQSLATMKDTSNLAKVTIEEQKTENLKTLNQILETHNQIKQLIGQLLALDLPNTLQKINSNIQKIQDENLKQFHDVKRIQKFSLIGLGVITILMGIFKFLH